ncbi:MAG TPA: SMP-30/gluconolactonase/LRE family protein [Gemmatimonadales bacterium]|jgi:gluconolactonase|nr:SMP-30/gluconolactonase/LRE family protein [Gemmatimonadales bacterium]
MGRPLIILVVAIAAAGALPAAAPAQVTGDAPTLGRPTAIVDLRTDQGVALVNGEWRFAPARVVPADNRDPGPDLRPSGAPNRTLDITPHAGDGAFDDSGWEVVRGPELERRRTKGKLSFAWYRLRLTVPPRIGGLDPTGSTIVFETVVDDYAEVWVDGKLPVALGQTGGQFIKGFNAPNRVVLTGDARPGQRITVAVFTANGPLSNPPRNFIWIRSATLDVYKPTDAGRSRAITVQVERKDAALDHLVPRDPAVEKVADGFLFTEGPVWHPDGYLLFSDPNANTIYRWSPEGQVSVFRTKSGYTGVDVGEYGQPGSNGLTLDSEGRLTVNEHGNRRVVRFERTGRLDVLADRYQGKRLNSPNDLVYRSDGTLFFTDPPFGLPKFGDDPRKELPFSGVYCVRDGALRLVTRDLEGPNGIGFSPDERFLYVGNWDLKRIVVMRYEVDADCAATNGRVFADFTREGGDDAIDGVKTDQEGNVYISGPKGLRIVSAAGKELGTVVLPEHPHNFAWGDADGRTLYLTARSGIYRMRLNVGGVRPPLTPRTLTRGN